MEEKELLWYWLTTRKGIGSRKIRELLEVFKEIYGIFDANESQLKQIKSLQKKDFLELLSKPEMKRLEHELDTMKKKKISFIYWGHKAYPESLRVLYDPPYGIYLKGSIPSNNKIKIGIVGARNCSNYGKEIALYFARELARHGIEVISGLARGIDSYAHMGALEGNGYTCAVLGNGIDYCYPRENTSLYVELERQGGVLSEYGPGVAPYAGNFPQRNRIISGLCDAVLVIEAKEKSGSFITVDQALEQGKEIYVVPGRVTDSLSTGCNQLIQMGAQLVMNPSDILINYSVNYNSFVKEKKNYDKLLERNEKIVYANLSLEPKHVSDLSKEIGMTMSELMGVLVILEIKGIVKQTVKNYYSVCVE